MSINDHDLSNSSLIKSNHELQEKVEAMVDKVFSIWEKVSIWEKKNLLLSKIIQGNWMS